MLTVVCMVASYYSVVGLWLMNLNPMVLILEV